MSGDAAELSRLRHLDHCRRFRCFARELIEFIYFELPKDHPQGPAHGVRITIQGKIDSPASNFLPAARADRARPGKHHGFHLLHL